MKLAHLYPSPGAALKLFIVVKQRALQVDALPGWQGVCNLQDLIAAGTLEGGSTPKNQHTLTELARAVEAAPPTSWLPLDALTFGPAVTAPPAALAVGLNYDEHASELQLDNEGGPVLFALLPNSLSAHNGQTPVRAEISTEVDYEGELGVIIGKAAKDVSVAQALDYVFGYTVINDITARDIQFREPQWSRCKSFDGFTPIGPWVVTADEIADPGNLKITTDVDDLRVQDSSTNFMIRSIASLISAISQGTTLMPGTVISTGSPGGAGRSRKPPLYLTPGTRVTVTIEGVGELTTHCV